MSELEGCVLGLIACKGPLTAYAIRLVFLDSPSSYWSGSAGAIYPLIRRLEKRGLVRSVVTSIGSRRSRRYLSTPSGRRALRGWLGPPVADWVVAVPADPLRTRLEFLSMLPPAARQAFTSEARARMHAHMRAVEEDCRRTRRDADPLAHLVAKGALATLRARAKWIDEVIATLRRPKGAARRE